VTEPHTRSTTRAAAPTVELRCLACAGSIELADRATACLCGRSSARPDGEGHAYNGPARAILVMLVHDPGARAMGTREMDIADTGVLLLAEIEPLT
jgi:hypothetical protein